MQFLVLLFFSLFAIECFSLHCDELMTMADSSAAASFTGKVEALVGGVAWVQIKRIYSGAEVLDDVMVRGERRLPVHLPEAPQRRRLRRQPCPLHPTLRVRDTKLFLVVAKVEKEDRRQRRVHVFLPDYGHVLPITLEVLERAAATAAKDMTYKPRSAIMEEPCEKTFCPFGAICESDGGEGRCRCPDEEECPPPLPPPSHALAPDASPPADNRHLLNPPPPLASTQVCGTDGETYASECLLRVRACRRPQLRLRVAHAGICGGSSTGHRRG